MTKCSLHTQYNKGCASCERAYKCSLHSEYNPGCINCEILFKELVKSLTPPPRKQVSLWQAKAEPSNYKPTWSNKAIFDELFAIAKYTFQKKVNELMTTEKFITIEAARRLASKDPNYKALVSLLATVDTRITKDLLAGISPSKV